MRIKWILYRLFWDDRPIGFEWWSYGTRNAYTYGNPEDPEEGWKQFEYNGHLVPTGWSGKYIDHNSKEILKVEYLEDTNDEELEEYED